MILFKIFDVKDTMAHLLLQESFDDYLLEEAKVTTTGTLQLSGRRNQEWFEEEKMPDNLYWKEVKSYIYFYIKGKRTPSAFTITLKTSQKEAKNLFEAEKLLQKMEEQKVDLLLHFRYEKGKLSLVTGVSYYEFSLDKQIEFMWDATAEQLLKSLKISYER